MNVKDRLCLLLIKFAVITTLAASPLGLYAQEAQQLEEIVVTAQKREQSLLNVPISTTVFNSEMVEQLGYTEVADVAAHVPNFFMSSGWGGTSTPNFTMRGIGNVNFDSLSINPVGLYQDNVYIGKNSFQGFQLFDLERIEVLRGPQGTLFGQNTTGGLVNFISRKPNVNDATNGTVKVTVGDYGRFDVDGAIGAAISENLSFRLAAQRISSDGYFENTNIAVDDDDPGSEGKVGVRGLLRWAPTESVDILLNLHYSRSDSNLSGHKPAYLFPNALGASVGILQTCPPDAVSGALFNGCTGPGQFGTTVDPGRFNIQTSNDLTEKIETYGYSLALDWEVGDYTFTLLSAWDGGSMIREFDTDGSPIRILDSNQDEDARYFSQELRLASNYSETFNWLLGGYWYEEHSEYDRIWDSRDQPGMQSGLPLQDGLAANRSHDTESYAIFGEGYYNLTEKLSFTLGLRLTSDSRKVTQDTFTYAIGELPEVALITMAQARARTIRAFIPRNTQEKDWDEWSGRAVLMYALADKQNVYLSASRGFKGGELNAVQNFSAALANISDPEFVDNYELGYKGLVFDGRLQASVAGFFMNYTDQQQFADDPSIPGFGAAFLNVGESEIYGVESEFQWKPTPNWLLSLGGAYLKTKITACDDCPGDFTGNQLGRAPEFNLNGVVRYDHPLRNGGTFSLQGAWDWRDDQFFNIDNFPLLSQDSYGLVNVRAGYRTRNDRTEVSLWLRNALDEEYVSYAFTVPFLGSNGYFIGDPRTYGASIRFSFD